MSLTRPVGSSIITAPLEPAEVLRRFLLPADGWPMVKIGEEPGELDKMLSKIADFYEDEVDIAIQSPASIIEPIRMIGVGSMVGTIVIAIRMPMFRMPELIK